MIVLEGGEKEKEMVTGIGKEIETGLIGVEIGRGPLVREPLKILQSVLHLTSYQKKSVPHALGCVFFFTTTGTVRLIPWFLLLRQAPASIFWIIFVVYETRQKPDPFGGAKPKEVVLEERKKVQPTSADSAALPKEPLQEKTSETPVKADTPKLLRLIFMLLTCKS